MPDIDQIMTLFRERGHSEYGGEAVTQLQHALQCATLAEADRASSSLIVAALLHDVGHLVHALPQDAPDRGIDDVHEELGQRYLRRMFDEAVTEPVRLHVAAKRYLCTTDPDYQYQLSQPSILSLNLQGGPMSEQEVAEFEASPFCEPAVRLRRWDDQGKIADLQTPDIEHFLPHLQAVAKQKEQSS
ncbi:MAG: HD domain-containing protein [Pirellulaceae bacterium]